MSASIRSFRFLERIAHPLPRERAAGERFSRFGELIMLVGETPARKLVARFGGLRVYIPHRPAPGDHLVRAVGIGAANKLARVFGGDRLLIPADGERALRRDRIRALRRHGLSISVIAHALHVTERYVYKVLADTRPP
jgi:hypothetical protein